MRIELWLLLLLAHPLLAAAQAHTNEEATPYEFTCAAGKDFLDAGQGDIDAAPYQRWIIDCWVGRLYSDSCGKSAGRYQPTRSGTTTLSRHKERKVIGAQFGLL